MVRFKYVQIKCLEVISSEAATHAMCNIFDTDDTDAILLIDASMANAFNSLSRTTALHNLRILCPIISTYAINTYRLPTKLFIVAGQGLKISEGKTQGDPLSMAIYAISLQPLIASLHLTFYAKQFWFANDASDAGMVTELKKCWDTLIADGRDYGYNPKHDKCRLIAQPKKEGIVREKFKLTDINITKEGKNTLEKWLDQEYVNEKMDGWVNEIISTQPQASYAVYTFGLKHRWTYY